MCFLERYVLFTSREPKKYWQYYIALFSENSTAQGLTDEMKVFQEIDFDYSKRKKYL